MMRLFVALNLPEDVRDALHQATAPLRAAGFPVRWVEATSFHVTLKFLGWVAPERLAAIRDAMASAAANSRPFELQVGGIGAFPSLRRPRVLWLGVDASPPLRGLKQDLEWAFAPLGFERELRAFQPHITLGRTVRDAGAGEFRALETILGDVAAEARVQVHEIDLMQSHLSPTGARYERIASVPLG
jgi:2'-5' RNA ligase